MSNVTINWYSASFLYFPIVMNAFCVEEADTMNVSQGGRADPYI